MNSNELQHKDPGRQTDYLRWPQPKEFERFSHEQSRMLAIIKEGLDHWIDIPQTPYEKLGQILDFELPADQKWYQALQQRVKDITAAIASERVKYIGLSEPLDIPEGYFWARWKWGDVETALYALLVGGEYKEIMAVLEECPTLDVMHERLQVKTRTGIPMPLIKATFRENVLEKLEDEWLQAYWEQLGELYDQAMGRKVIIPRA